MEQKWDIILSDLKARFATEDAMAGELARRQGHDDAFPEDMVERGRRIFQAASARVGRALCDDPRVAVLLNDSGPRTSEVLTIVPILVSLLPAGSLDDVSVALVGLMIARMGLGAFCRSNGRRGQ